MEKQQGLEEVNKLLKKIASLKKEISELEKQIIKIESSFKKTKTIHVVIMDNAPDDAVTKIVEIGKITNLNERRAYRFGIVTGEVDVNDTDVESRLKELSFVEAVEIDSRKVTY